VHAGDGINVGKSTLIMRWSRPVARTGDEPAITRHQSTTAGDRMELIDTPGLMWPASATRAMA
jgi:ribosome biogenesis GTPase A